MDDPGDTPTDGPTQPATDGDRWCTNCGSPIETDEWHPVTTERESGELRIYSFCTQACRDAWTEDAREE